MTIFPHQPFHTHTHTLMPIPIPIPTHLHVPHVCALLHLSSTSCNWCCSDGICGVVIWIDWPHSPCNTSVRYPRNGIAVMDIILLIFPRIFPPRFSLFLHYILSVSLFLFPQLSCSPFFSLSSSFFLFSLAFVLFICFNYLFFPPIVAVHFTVPLILVLPFCY